MIDFMRDHFTPHAEMPESSPPTFTVITATFNPGPLLDRTMRSLAAQTFQDFEWIVIDGGSTDDTLTRIQAGPLHPAFCISEPDEGIADAWNKGIARARGKHVAILNAGDTFDPRFLQRVLECADAKRIVCSHARLLTEGGRQVGVLRAEPRKLYRAMHVPHNWCVVPRQLYEEFGGYTKLPQAMDFEWFHRYFLRRGVQGFIVIDEAMGEYRLGGTSDVNYAESFRIKERIIVSHGGNPVRARLFCVAYTLKHAAVRLLRRGS